MVPGTCRGLLWLLPALWSEAGARAKDFGSARSCRLADSEFAHDLETTFLQQQLTVQSSTLAEDKEKKKERKKRERERGRERKKERVRESQQVELPRSIRWVHIAKTGTSFYFTLLQLPPPICMPGSEHLISHDFMPKVKDVKTWCPGIDLRDNCLEDMNFDACCEQPIGDLELNGRHLVGFFRQPEIRIMSDSLPNSAGMDPEQYAQLVQGCSVKMLTMNSSYTPAIGPYHCNDGTSPPSWAQVDRALDRLQNEYAFVGMTDDWDLSICLFNTMFGIACHESQFETVSHPSQKSSSNSSDVSPLHGFVDPYDAPLWEAAQQIFQANLVRFNVSKENCQPCWEMQ